MPGFPHHPARVLIVENNALIGLDLADDLEVQGYGTAGPFTCAAALKWIEGNTPDVAILDVGLQSGLCVQLARELRRRTVPLIVYSAYDQSLALPEFRNVPWIPMPASRQILRETMDKLSVGIGA
jgi:DNA-binding NtrC family response regulator